MKYVPPKVRERSFTCPHCGVLSRQFWIGATWDLEQFRDSDNLYELWVGCCDHCEQRTIWVKENMYYPDFGSVQFPNPNMPESVKEIYQEAASIVHKSPRGAAALLRLSVQILCKELGESGKNINKDIGELVKRGLPKMVQESFDIVRVTGNDAVHPGQIDTDDINVVKDLFVLVNVVVEQMISLPNKVSDLYQSLPANKREGIKNRDKQITK